MNKNSIARYQLLNLVYLIFMILYCFEYFTNIRFTGIAENIPLAIFVILGPFSWYFFVCRPWTYELQRKRAERNGNDEGRGAD